VIDSAAPECDNAIGDLAAGDSVTYTCTVANVQDSFTNIGTVSGESSSGTIVTNEDPSTTATDYCTGDPSVEITSYDCFIFTKKGKRIDKTESCIVNIDDDTITIIDTGGVGDHIVWIVRSMDDCGNVSESTCGIMVVKPRR
jgi:hypothetical protein